MPKKKSYLTAKDMFCGAGGSTQGAIDAGIEVIQAMNHWDVAVKTYNTNYPNCRVDCADVSAADPRRYPSTDILIASPECTNHSLAKGVPIGKKQFDLFKSGIMDPAADRSRATMWDVPRFAEYHNYNCIIVENVVDARKWVLFESWLTTMYALGYLHKCCYLNSMHFHPTPQSRDRMYIVFWKKGNKAPDLEYMPLAYCNKCGKDVMSIQTWKDGRKRYGKYDQQYVYCCPNDGSKVEPYYYASFNCIDWTDLGTRIGDRKKPLCENTTRRINYGLNKYGNVPLQIFNYSPGYTKPVTEPTGTITCQDHHGILTPFIIKGEHTKSSSNMVRGVNEVMQTQVTRQSMSIITPFITISRGQSKTRDITQPLTTQSQMVNQGIVTDDSFNSFIASYNTGSHCTKHITEVSGTVTTNDRLSIVNYSTPNIEDCYYRMLRPPEIQSAMAFNKDYQVLGSGKEQVKQLGNAVTPPPMKWLVSRVKDSLN